MLQNYYFPWELEQEFLKFVDYYNIQYLRNRQYVSVIV
jgi:hypothetical protein